MQDATGLLQGLGFSEYEARAYIALLGHHPANGYALTKQSDIPRPNIYAVLQKLEERGAVVALETESGTSYSPVGPDALIQRLSQHLHGTLNAARQVLEQVATPNEQCYVQNIHGYAALIEHAHELIGRAQTQLT